MINMILKDFKLIRNKTIIFSTIYGLALSVLFQRVMAPEAAFMFGILITTYAMVLYPLSFDGRKKGGIVMISLPIKRYELVIARYISSMLFMIAAFLIIMLGNILLKTIANGLVIRYPVFNDFLMIFVITGVVISFIIPLNYIFGDKGTTIINSVIFLTFIIGPNILVNLLRKNPNNKAAIYYVNFLINGPGSIEIYPILLVCILLIISILISIFVYNRKEVI